LFVDAFGVFVVIINEKWGGRVCCSGGGAMMSNKGSSNSTFRDQVEGSKNNNKLGIQILHSGIKLRGQKTTTS